jgi:glycosyltransferase involved in cell wall biosynthesis
MSAPLPISVIIPHHNRSELLGTALKSILGQTCPPSEIIVVDDCSAPPHREAIRAWSSHTRIIFLDPGGGPAKARNAGIEAASQEWIAFLDDDDEWLPEKLAMQWKVLNADLSLSAVVGAPVIVSDTREPWTMVSHSPEILTLAAALEDNAAFIQTALVKTATIRALKGFDTNLLCLEDQDFWIRFTAAGFRCRNDGIPVMILNRRRIKRLSTYWRRCIESQFKVIAKHEHFYVTEFGPGAAKRARSKAISRAGLESGGIVGRALFAVGCVYGGDLRRLLTLLSTGKMPIIPYGVTENSDSRAPRTRTLP